MLSFGAGLAIALAAWGFAALLIFIKKKLRRFISGKADCH